MTLHEWPAYGRLPIDVTGAEGCELVLSDGKRVLDLYGGHCVNTLGAGDPALGECLAQQWRTLSFVTNLLDHAPRQEFLAAFEPNLPAGDWMVFASNSGAEANENALKAACAATGRGRVVSFTGSFHGRSAAVAALSDGAGAVLEAPFEVVRTPFGDLEAATEAIDEHTACVLLEPIQSLAGVVDPPEGFLTGLRAHCDAMGALLVFDEVQTGSGRLGLPWASQHFDVLPDLFTTAKGAAAGLPIGLTVARPGVVERAGRGLLGSTFGGGPLVFAAAAEVARRIAAPGFLENVRATSAALREACLRGPVQAVRGAGLLLGLELEQGLSERGGAASVRDHLLEEGVLVGTSNDPNVLRLSPPLTLPSDAAARLSDALDAIEVAL